MGWLWTLGVILCVLCIGRTSAMSLFSSSDSSDDRNTVTLDDDVQRVLELPRMQARELWKLVIARNFSVAIELKQRRNTEGTLFAFYGGRMGREVLLQLDSSAKSRKVNLKFRTPSGSIKVYTGDVNLGDGKWHQLLFGVQGHRLHLVVDCKELYNREDLDLRFGVERSLRVLIGQKTWRRHKFQGGLREFSADVGYPIGDKCPTLQRLPNWIPSQISGQQSTVRTETSTRRPTTNDVMHNSDNALPASAESTTANIGHAVSKAVEYLTHRVGYLENQFKHWRSVVQGYETQLKRVQLHQRGCQIDTVLMEDGETWTNTSTCTSCLCSVNVVHCRPIGCPSLTCPHPLLLPDTCCPTCGLRCYYTGRYYDHGEAFWPKECVMCQCVDGNMDCQYKRKQDCPQLSCPQHRQKTPPKQCCPVCVNDDFCSANPCHDNATCTNEKYSARCRCAEGFFGNGKDCFDVDECQWDRQTRDQLGGCGQGTRCINTQGGFRCECLPGYAQMDGKHCLDVIRV